MNPLDHSSQENAAASEEIASTAEEISSQSSVMISLIDNLNAVVNGDVKAS